MRFQAQFHFIFEISYHLTDAMLWVFMILLLNNQIVDYLQGQIILLSFLLFFLFITWLIFIYPDIHFLLYFLEDLAHSSNHSHNNCLYNILYFLFFSWADALHLFYGQLFWWTWCSHRFFIFTINLFLYFRLYFLQFSITLLSIYFFRIFLSVRRSSTCFFLMIILLFFFFHFCPLDKACKTFIFLGTWLRLLLFLISYYLFRFLFLTHKRFFHDTFFRNRFWSCFSNFFWVQDDVWSEYFRGSFPPFFLFLFNFFLILFFLNNLNNFFLLFFFLNVRSKCFFIIFLLLNPFLLRNNFLFLFFDLLLGLFLFHSSRKKSNFLIFWFDIAVMLLFNNTFNLRLKHITVVIFNLIVKLIVDGQLIIFIFELSQLPSIGQFLYKLLLFIVIFKFPSHDEM